EAIDHAHTRPGGELERVVAAITIHLAHEGGAREDDDAIVSGAAAEGRQDDADAGRADGAEIDQGDPRGAVRVDVHAYPACHGPEIGHRGVGTASDIDAGGAAADLTVIRDIGDDSAAAHQADSDPAAIDRVVGEGEEVGARDRSAVGDLAA